MSEKACWTCDGGWPSYRCWECESFSEWKPLNGTYTFTGTDQYGNEKVEKVKVSVKDGKLVIDGGQLCGCK